MTHEAQGTPRRHRHPHGGRLSTLRHVTTPRDVASPGFPPALRRAVVPVALTVICVIGLVGVALGATEPVRPGVTPVQSGHWVIDKTKGAVVHVHGGTERVDAGVNVSDEAVADGRMVLQGATDGFVVGRDRVWVFDKSELTVDAQFPLPPTDDSTIGIEVPGGPYLVHPAGGIVRLTRSGPVDIPVDGPLGTPVGAADGTVWVDRNVDGALCALRPDAAALDCGVGDEATAIRRAVVVPGSNLLRLVDGTGASDGSPSDISLKPGEYGPPQLSGDIVAVVESSAGTLRTFRPGGVEVDESDLAPGTADAAMRRGEDGRIYVDDGDGRHVHIVRSNGEIATVDLRGAASTEAAVAAPEDQREPVVPPPPGQVAAPRPEADVRTAPPPPDPPAPEQQAPVEPLPTVLAAPETPTQPMPDDAAPEGPALPGPPAPEQPAPPGPEQQPVPEQPTPGPIDSAPADRASDEPAAPTPPHSATTESEPPVVEPSREAEQVRVEKPDAPVPLPLKRDDTYVGDQYFERYLVTWQQPDLHGGEFVEYEYLTADRRTASASDYWRTTREPEAYLDGFVCDRPFTIEIRAVTRTPGSDDRIVGPSTIMSSPDYDCSIHISIDAELADPDTVLVTLSEPSPQVPVAGNCEILVNGVPSYGLLCGDVLPNPEPILVDVAQPSNTYTVRLEADNKDRQKSYSNIVECRVGETHCEPAP